tara:strand:- start:1057 stop:1677 length:621 start_codon:yes stop_codon:yes gene_type:complete
MNKEIKNVVILLHGYGGDGSDISSITLNWKRFLPNTLFVCPNAPEKCSINPSGYQWFDLNSEDEEYILNESKKSELMVNTFLDEIKKEFKIHNSQICLSGFSQGCMMCLNVGLTSEINYSGILGFSGKIISKNYLKNNIKSKTNIFLIHGDNDEIVPCEASLEAKDFLDRNKIPTQLKIIKNCGHHIPIEASSTGLAFIKKIFTII